MGSNYLLAAAAGLIQGLTEFLPISSSGHLLIFHELFNFNVSDDVLFDVVLHLGTSVAIITVFYRELLAIVRGFFSSLVKWNVREDSNQRMAWLLLLATIPAALIGVLFESAIENHLRSLWVVATTLIVFALVLWAAEKYSTKNRTIKQLNWWQAVGLGCAQALALIPGVSRSGMTISTGLFMGLKRAEAAQFSFLLSLPIILGAAAKKSLDINTSTGTDIGVMITGFLVSAITGYLVIRFLLQYLARHGFGIFIWYRLIVGIGLISWLALR
ncbi:MAG: undecaprenyl-diphosphatase UppP [Candidatus Buchananbacteria bacterium]|nr:undecaprenyl-diphosphatase UppP [Candidatus Buchananbacteria bacterium]